MVISTTNKETAMGSGYNLPPGCYESDLPGWHDIEVDLDFCCDSCDREWTEHDVTVDSRGEDGLESECKECGQTTRTNYTPAGRWDPD
jgi:hypothetical protein